MDPLSLAHDKALPGVGGEESMQRVVIEQTAQGMQAVAMRLRLSESARARARKR